MISSYQISFLIKWDGPTMYVSHWFPTEHLLPLTYLLFLLRYDDYVPEELSEFVSQIRQSFPLESQESETNSKPKQINDRKGGDHGSNKNDRRGFISLYDYYKKLSHKSTKNIILKVQQLLRIDFKQ
jgi:hypothetical protein